MNHLIEEMLRNYEVQTSYDKKNAMKEIMQEIKRASSFILCG